MKAENPAHALALVMTDEFVRCGVTDACVAPGSRSAPVAMALASDGRVRVHVRIDERSASFLALGMAKASGRPALALCTSGTAAANFHPAVLEAHHARVPLIVLTADRPPELRDTAANQTIDQSKLYGDSVRWFVDAGVPEARPDSVSYWRNLATRAYAAATGSPPGPVHLNLPFRDPLVPVGEGFPHPLEGRADGAPWLTLADPPSPPAESVIAELAARIAATERGVMVAGDARLEPEPLMRLARAASWPVIAEPTSNLRCGAAISTYDSLLRHEGFAREHTPELVMRVGKTATSKALARWLGPDVEQVLVDRDGTILDPDRSISRVVRADPSATAAALTAMLPPREGSAWLDSWLKAEAAARRAMDSMLDSHIFPTEPRIARDVADLLPEGSTLVVASSMPVRDLDYFMRPRLGLRVLGNRGVSGIDGFVSTAIGAALATEGPVAALAGDLSMLHDSNGLGVLEGDGPDLTFVVLNNDGGGIFSFLPQARWPESFERVFGTPHGLDLAALASLYKCGFIRIGSSDELPQAMTEARGAGGIWLLEVRTDRAKNVTAHAEVWSAVKRAVDEIT